ncbi:hypothetical protein LI108_12355 [Streptococcus gordonii]|nr:hypothetical protein [Streptococcus gordonii]MCC2832525.1 hypothetical protein [[Clostridium] innocuum]
MLISTVYSISVPAANIFTAYGSFICPISLML